MRLQKGSLNKNLKSVSGFSMVELLTVMATLAILGGVLISVVASGGSHFKHIQNNYKSENEARTALSYITVKARQNDRILQSGDRGVQAHDNKLYIYLPGGTDYFEIGLFGDKLKELQYKSGILQNEDAIAEGLKDFSVSSADGRIFNVSISYDSDAGEKSLGEKIYLRSGS